MIAALYVEKNGVYYGLPGVDPWDEERDARKYQGPHKVIAHPPCQRWGRYWSGGPNPKSPRRILGDDNGCFASALWSVRTYGGVLEHPEASHAWSYHLIPKPPKAGGWVSANDLWGGYTCCVEQGNYGHAARKATWLYIVGIEPKDLVWGKSVGKARMDEGYRSKGVATQARLNGAVPIKRLSSVERLSTPIAFRDALIELVK